MENIHHLAAGNPLRFLPVPETLTADQRWLAGMSRSDKIWSTLLTYPALGKFDYPVSIASSKVGPSKRSQR
jgi:hypothetical protein